MRGWFRRKERSRSAAAVARFYRGSFAESVVLANGLFCNERGYLCGLRENNSFT